MIDVDGPAALKGRVAGPRGVRVNCIAPETILTERNLQQIPADMEEQPRIAHPVARVGGPDDVAQAALFLASEPADQSLSERSSPEPTQLFATAVDYYARYRSGYPAHGISALAAQLGLDGSQTVLDIGCGTGQMAIPLARHAGLVVAIDPLQEMLDRGRQTAVAAGMENIVWRRGDSGHLLELVEPGASAAVFAASFHWTDRPVVARTLDELLAANGSVVVIHEDLDGSEEPDWVRAIDEIRSAYLSHTSPHSALSTMAARSHRQVLAESPFSHVERSTWSWERELTVDQAVGLQFSYSASTPALFGEKTKAFAHDARTTLLQMYPSAVVIEPFRVEVLVAKRP